MEDRPDLLLGIIVIHVAKQQQLQQHVAGKSTTKTWMYSERQERTVTESAVSVRTTPTTTSAPSSTVVREIETIASPANQVAMSLSLYIQASSVLVI